MDEISEQNNSRLIEMRLFNKRRIMRYLLANRDVSSKMLADDLGLSNSAVVNIADEMYKNGYLVKQIDESATTRGRKATIFSIEGKIGMIIVVNFCTENFITVSDCAGKTLFCSKRKMGLVTKQDIEYVYSEINRLCTDSEFSVYKLRGIAVSTSGKIDAKTGAFVYSPGIEDWQNFNIKEELERRFKVPVVIKNDKVFSMYAEQNYGPQREQIFNTLYLRGLGCSFCLNGQIFEGHHGFAGEIGLSIIDVNNDVSDYFKTFKHTRLNSAISQERLVKIIRKTLESGRKESFLNQLGKPIEEIDADDIISAYKAGDPLTRGLVHTQMEILSCVLKNILELLDLDNIILAGESAQYGEEYRAELESCLNDRMTHITVKVILSEFEGDSSTQGAVFYTLDNAFERIV